MDNNVTTWFELYSPNPNSSKDFYANVFGWSTTEMDMGDFMYPMMANGDKPAHCGVMNTATPEMEGVPPHWLVYFHTPDMAASLEKVSSAGGNVMHGPMDIPGVGKITILADNNGAVFALHEPAAELQ